jgi:hypothetical protein
MELQQQTRIQEGKTFTYLYARLWVGEHDQKIYWTCPHCERLINNNNVLGHLKTHKK